MPESLNILKNADKYILHHFKTVLTILGDGKGDFEQPLLIGSDKKPESPRVTRFQTIHQLPVLTNVVRFYIRWEIIIRFRSDFNAGPRLFLL